MNKMRSVQALFISLLFSILIGCGPSLPLIDARIDDYQRLKRRIDWQIGLLNDKFQNNPSVKGNLTERIPSSMFFASTHGIPFSFHFTKQFRQRFEFGFGVVGVYEKLALLKPKDYDSFSLKKLAISQVFHVGAGFIGDHGYFGATMDGGLLLGIPLSVYSSITIGVIGEYVERSASTSARFTDFKTWGETLDVTRESVVFPITFTRHLSRGNLTMSLKIPVDISEKYSLSESYTDSSEAGKREGSINLNHRNLPNVAFTMGFSWRRVRVKRMGW